MQFLTWTPSSLKKDNIDWQKTKFLFRKTEKDNKKIEEDTRTEIAETAFRSACIFIAVAPEQCHLFVNIFLSVNSAILSPSLFLPLFKCPLRCCISLSVKMKSAQIHCNATIEKKAEKNSEVNWQKANKRARKNLQFFYLSQWHRRSVSHRLLLHFDCQFRA